MNSKTKSTILLVLVIIIILLGVAILAVESGMTIKLPTFTSKTTAEPTAEATKQAESTETPAPTEEPKALSGITVCIDPGHQAQGNYDKEALAPWGEEYNSECNNTIMKTKTTSGTTGKFSGINEHVINLQIALKIKARLEAQGATVVMTRETEDVDLSNIDRAEIGNNANADVVLRIHCNGVDNTTVSGIETWVRNIGKGTDEYKELAAYDYSLATELLDYLVEATGAKKRSVNKSDAYTGINWSTVPCIIIECGFMTNEEEDLKLADEEYQEKFAIGVENWLLNTTVLKKKG